MNTRNSNNSTTQELDFIQQKDVSNEAFVKVISQEKQPRRYLLSKSVSLVPRKLKPSHSMMGVRSLKPPKGSQNF